MRVRSLDSLRFIAALCVAIYHFNIDLKLGLDSSLHAVNHFGLWVDFFFVLSGFVIALNYQDRIHTLQEYGSFLQKRLARVYPLHFVTLMAFVLLGLAAESAHVAINHADFFSLKALPANLLLVHAWGVLNHGSFNNASWSISAELFVYLLFPVLAQIAAGARLALNIAAIVALVFVLEHVRPAFGLKEWSGATYDYGNLRALPTFFYGVVMARAFPDLRARFRPHWAFVYGLALLVLLSMQWNLPDEITIALMALLMITCACAEAANPRGLLLSGPLTAFGDASYSIYMTHGLTLLATVVIVKRTCGLGTPGAALIGAAALALTLVVSLFVYRLFEDPARRYLSAIRFSTPFRATA